MDSTVTIGKSYFEALLRRYVHPIHIPHSLAASQPDLLKLHRLTFNHSAEFVSAAVSAAYPRHV